ncbi:hypothetical protein, partial [Bacillus sp. S1-R2T1-FB]|uniref:hypothetical protein n=1 Tax=Bacillus sp. S1-R2T1-FB TaxID=1973493 RepID=UPI001C4E7C22
SLYVLTLRYSPVCIHQLPSNHFHTRYLARALSLLTDTQHNRLSQQKYLINSKFFLDVYGDQQDILRVESG